MKISRRPVDTGLAGGSGGGGYDEGIEDVSIEVEERNIFRRPVSEALAGAEERSAYRGPISEALEQARAEAESAALAASPPDAWLDPANIPTSPAIERYLQTERLAAAWRVLKLGLIASGAGSGLFLLLLTGILPTGTFPALGILAATLFLLGIPFIVSGLMDRRRARR